MMLINLPKFTQVGGGRAGMEIQVWLPKRIPLDQEVGND